MVSILKSKSLAVSLEEKLRADQLALEQSKRSALAEQRAAAIKMRSEDTLRKQPVFADPQLLANIDKGYRGEIRYKLLGNERIRIDQDQQLRHERGLLRKTTNVLKRKASSGELYLGTHMRKTWASVTTHKFGEDGSLRARHVKYKDGRYEERWERDEQGALIRTKYMNKGSIGVGLGRTIVEEMSAPYRSGADQKLFRRIWRQSGSKKEIFERDDKGNLELLSRKRRWFSKEVLKTEDRRSALTVIRRFGGAISKTYRSLLDTEGNQIGREVVSHRRLFNKISANYDDQTGQLKSYKHTLGKLFKREALYLNEHVKSVSTKILGVTVARHLTVIAEDERADRKLRDMEVASHQQAWPRPLGNQPVLRENNTGGDSVKPAAAVGQDQKSINDTPTLASTPSASPDFRERASRLLAGLRSSGIQSENSGAKPAQNSGVTEPKPMPLPLKDTLGRLGGNSTDNRLNSLQPASAVPSGSSKNDQAATSVSSSQQPKNPQQNEISNLLQAMPVPGFDKRPNAIATGGQFNSLRPLGSDPQSLFGEPSSQHNQKVSPVSPSHNAKPLNTEEQAKVNELLSFPLPDAGNATSPLGGYDTRSRDRSASSAVTL
ncbi:MULTISPECIES: hypothetical protein [Rhizobium/Agrobacterium group]|uniref:VirE3 n=1 Tax=Agrobacterium tumefaciens TaxID=358 RepID=Q8VT81_AGRTU|nr:MULTISPECIES: hypothetical protein [Rhizobium/Agrobacterium group]AAL57030.1 VirE3 [Agrobacterium tumefaciens]MBO9112517.1 hypothetical protein [Agrobacterium sp. S2/73]QXZ76022.1 hypothetical protein J5276_28500 [Agrobacterium sp. S7/73]QYA16967.1 hypothetical protein J5284_33005 [Rhizobium sp. AB2/73]UEQ85460.1 hypothetical protein I8E17_31055 [Rhizobium sp. AB2/73]